MILLENFHNQFDSICTNYLHKYFTILVDIFYYWLYIYMRKNMSMDEIVFGTRIDDDVCCFLCNPMIEKDDRISYLDDEKKGRKKPIP